MREAPKRIAYPASCFFRRNKLTRTGGARVWHPMKKMIEYVKRLTAAANPAHPTLPKNREEARNMELSDSIAREIVGELSKVTALNINIMDAEGRIIASIDPSRIGTYHAGAHRIMTQNLSELVIRNGDRLEGARPGLNYPIRIDGQSVGVLGITGEYGEIVDSARIIKRMTELLLQSAYNTEQKQFGKSVRNRYFDEWVNGDVKSITAEFVDRGRALGFDITLPRRFLDCSVYAPTHDAGMEVMRAIEQAEEAAVQYVLGLNRSNIYFKAGASLVLAVTETTDEGILRVAKQLVAIVDAMPGIRLAVGVDAGVEPFHAAKSALHRARVANRACMRTHRWNIRFYNDLRMELIVDGMSDPAKIEYVKRLFPGYTQNEIVDAMILLENYYETEGSVAKTAERLYIHKNTLQYKLKKIAERTGYDPRSIRHSSLFYNAIFFYRNLSE